MDAAFANHLQGLAIQGEGYGDGVRPIRDIDNIVDNSHPMRVCDSANAPAVEIIAIAGEDEHGRVLALKDVEAVLGIGCYRADNAKRLPSGELGIVLEKFVSIFACANLCHN
jgi:hypothetical protein